MKILENLISPLHTLFRLCELDFFSDNNFWFHPSQLDFDTQRLNFAWFSTSIWTFILTAEIFIFVDSNLLLMGINVFHIAQTHCANQVADAWKLLLYLFHNSAKLSLLLLLLLLLLL